jgi:outer membrane protein assembly factor BamB
MAGPSHAGVRQELVVANSKAVDSYDPKSGNLNWHIECLAGEVASSPAFSDGIIVVASEGSAATAIEKVADGTSKIRWEWDESLPDTSSPVAHNGLVMIPTGFGVLSCLDIKTGKLHWEHQFETGFSSSPIIVGDKVFLADLSGKLQIFKLATNFELLGVGNLGEPVYATPGFVGDRIYVRSLNHLFCITATGK